MLGDFFSFVKQIFWFPILLIVLPIVLDLLFKLFKKKINKN